MRVVFFYVIFSLCTGTLLCAQSAPRELFKFAKFKHDNGEYEAAMAFLNQAIDADSAYSSAYLLRAEVHFALSKFFAAIHDVQQAFRLESPSPGQEAIYRTLAGRSYAALKDYKNALNELDRAIKLNSKMATALYQRSSILYRQSNYTAALDDIDKAINLSPDVAEYYAHRATMKIEYYNPVYGAEAYNSALSDINVAIALQPQGYDFYKVRSQLQRNAGQTDEALSDYNKMVTLAPEKVDAYTERGMIKLNQYQYAGAAGDFSQSIKLNPTEERNYRMRGLCNHNMENYRQAFEDFSRSIELLSQRLTTYVEDKKEVQNLLAETYLMRGHSLNVMGRNSEACHDFLRAHNLGIKKGLNYYRKFCGIY
jgi:tetratricopeptide (TPR) repeat protein